MTWYQGICSSLHSSDHDCCPCPTPKLSMLYLNITSCPRQESLGGVWTTEFREKVPQRWSCMGKSFPPLLSKTLFTLPWCWWRTQGRSPNFLLVEHYGNGDPLLRFMQSENGFEGVGLSKHRGLFQVSPCVKCFVHTKRHLLSCTFYHLDIHDLSPPSRRRGL